MISLIFGITDDSTTVFGRATNPSGQQEGFIAHFPAGFLQNDLGNVTWLSNAANGDWSDPSNWSPGGPPAPPYTASFSVSNQTAISLADYVSLQKIIFNANASAFSIAISDGFGLDITGAGITNNSANTQSFTVGETGFLEFANGATAGNSTIFTADGGGTDGSYGGLIDFLGTSSADNGVFVLNGSSTPTASGAFMFFSENSTAANGTLIANAGTNGGFGTQIFFQDSSKGGTARVKVFGDSALDVSFHNPPGITIGSIEGDGNVYLANMLTVGSNNLSTSFSGHVYDFGGGSRFTKTGTGILTLTGRADNDYFDDTITVNITNGSTINLDYNGTDTIGGLIIDGVVQNPGLYGSGTNSNAIHNGNPSTVSGLIGNGHLLATNPVAVSRKMHGATPRDIYLPMKGGIGVECRSPGPNNSYQLIVSFIGPVNFTGANVTSGNGMVTSVTGNGTSVVTANLAGVTNAQTIIVTLFGVNDGSSVRDMVIPMSILIGDVNGSGSVNSSDISQVKIQSGQAVSGSNYRTDLTSDGQINSTDISLAKLRSGTGLGTQYFENFDNGTASGFDFSGLWHLTHNYPGSGTYSLGFVQDETSSATPNGDYDTGTVIDDIAFSGPIAVVGAQPMLSFKAFVGDEWDLAPESFDRLSVWDLNGRLND